MLGINKSKPKILTFLNVRDYSSNSSAHEASHKPTGRVLHKPGGSNLGNHNIILVLRPPNGYFFCNHLL